jgi:hypothetical protein
VQGDEPNPIWKITLTPMAMTQSTTLKAKMSGIELMYKLKNHLSHRQSAIYSSRSIEQAHGKEATEI